MSGAERGDWQWAGRGQTQGPGAAVNGDGTNRVPSKKAEIHDGGSFTLGTRIKGIGAHEMTLGRKCAIPMLILTYFT